MTNSLKLLINVLLFVTIYIVYNEKKKHTHLLAGDSLYSSVYANIYLILAILKVSFYSQINLNENE